MRRALPRRSLAVVAAPRVSERVAEHVLAFAATHAPEAAAGVVDFEGLRRFRGKGLEALNASHDDEPRRGPAVQKSPRDFFSDMNQWMLKVLIAPELPETLLSAPRGRYLNASELASAACVSVMTAFRFVDHLRRDGHIHESRRHLELVRRDALFKRWQAATMIRPVKELPMRFLLPPGDINRELRRMSRDRGACVGLFAAAQALGFGLVEGVPPHVYVRRLDTASMASIENVIQTDQGDGVQLVVRQASAPESVFRGAVCVADIVVSDVFQTWLDVAGHPSRGAEQAELIGRVLGDVLTRDE